MATSVRTHDRNLISQRFSLNAPRRPAVRNPSQLPFIAEVKAKLESGKYKLEHSPCPCGTSEGPTISEIDRYGLPLNFVLCTTCGTIRIEPYLDEVSLADFYTRYFQKMYGRAPDVESYFIKQKSYGQKLLALSRQWLKPGSWIYEIGCGAGGALDVFRSNGYLVAGCDYSAELIAAGKERGLENIYCGSLDDIPLQSKVDLIYLTHVFEHMRDPIGFLADCRKRLAPDGRIVITVPDVSRIDSFTVPAGDLLQFLHLAHKYNFSFVGLCRLSARAGYHVELLVPDPKIETAHSIMPELWIGLTINAEAKCETRKLGNKTLQYLKRTEKMYALGLCRAQLAQKINQSKIGNNLARLRRATPAKIVRKLKHTG